VITLILFSGILKLYSLSFINPPLKKDFYPVKFPGISKFLFSPDRFKSQVTLSLDYIDATRFGLFLNLQADAQLSKLINFDTRLKIGSRRDTILLQSFYTSWYLHPARFFQFHTGYLFRNFLHYQIAEHQTVFFSVWMNHLFRRVHLDAILGLTIRMSDLDVRDPVKILHENFEVSVFPVWQLKLMIHPLSFYSAGLTLGNRDEYELFSLNYWQLELIQHFRLPHRFTLLIRGGFAYSGSLPFAGIINRGWIETGVNYALPLH
jgi:hypothetical protein